MLLALLLFSVNALAETKIAVVSTQRLFEEAPQVTAANTKLKKEFSSRSGALQKTQNAIKDKMIKLDKDQALMTADAVSKLQREITNLQRDYQREKKALEEDLSLRQNDLRGEINTQVMETIKSIGKRDGYDLILSEMAVGYFSEKVDITESILKELKTKYKASK